MNQDILIACPLEEIPPATLTEDGLTRPGEGRFRVFGFRDIGDMTLRPTGTEVVAHSLSQRAIKGQGPRVLLRVGTAWFVIDRG